MKSANQLMATMQNLPPEMHGGPVVVSLETAEVVNGLFRRLRGIFPAWRQAWPSTEALAAAKEEWIKEFAAEGIRTIEQIEFGIEKCRKLKKPFAPSVGEFIAMCQPTPEDFGMPAPAAAWVEALLGVYSHEGVKIAAVATGLFDLRAAQQNDKGLQARFDRAYDIVLRRAKEGQPLDGKIATGIGHDSQKSLIELADEYASQRQARLLHLQQIPSSAAACRAHLLAKLNIKRAGQPAGEGV
ncbi:replication protein P [Pseudomonas sp. DCB_BI]|uniref:replication protein P n=1 Tax=Pseudomonas sp. DCB_BI TaxID=2993594 RepID=UPI00224B4B0C|nr:replication protein P [Pseudomonas sp. DCB_BI]MCX2891746.1 replication protein P [Pseudomonas sp. DCB_BI]